MASKMQVVLLCAVAASAAAAPMAIVATGLLGQQWFFDAGTWRIRSAVAPTKCIDAGDGKSGTKLTLADCNETSTSQYFGWDATTNFIFATPDKRGLHDAKRVCMQRDNKTHGGQVFLNSCFQHGEQEWSAVVGPAPGPTKNETFTFSPVLSNGKLCLDLKGSKVDNGNPIDLVQCQAGSKAQEWIFDQGSYRIASALAPNKCIDATDVKTGTKLILWDCNGFPQQQWGYEASATGNEGTVYLTQSPESRECLATDATNTAAVVGACVPWVLTKLGTTIVV